MPPRPPDALARRLALAPRHAGAAARGVRDAAGRVEKVAAVALPGHWRAYMASRRALGEAVDGWCATGEADARTIGRWVDRRVTPSLNAARARAAGLQNPQPPSEKGETCFARGPDFARGPVPVGEVLVLGLTGVGKSTLVNAALGWEAAATAVGAPVTRGIVRHASLDGFASLVDTEGLETQGRAPLEQRADRLALLARLADVVWYCVNAESARVQPAELALIARLGAIAPLIAVLTRALEPPAALRDELARLVGPQHAIVSVLAQERRLGPATLPSHGLPLLVGASNAFLSLPRPGRERL